MAETLASGRRDDAGEPCNSASAGAPSKGTRTCAHLKQELRHNYILGTVENNILGEFALNMS